MRQIKKENIIISSTISSLTLSHLMKTDLEEKKVGFEKDSPSIVDGWWLWDDDLLRCDKMGNDGGKLGDEMMV